VVKSVCVAIKLIATHLFDGIVGNSS